MFLEFALEIMPLITQTTQGTHSSRIPQTQITQLVQRKHSNISLQHQLKRMENERK